MKLCTSCSNTLTADAIHCYVCNTEQTKGFEEFEAKPKYNDAFLKVLCILTIVGVAFSLIGTIFSLAKGAAFPVEGMKFLTIISFGLAIGKLIAAILMLRKKLIGLYVYSLAAVIGIVVQLYSLSITADYMDGMMGGNGSTIVIASAAVVVIISLTFLILYWLPINKKLLS